MYNKQDKYPGTPLSSASLRVHLFQDAANLTRVLADLTSIGEVELVVDSNFAH